MIGSCRQQDDIVAIQFVDASIDVGSSDATLPPPVVDSAPPPLDITFDIDASPPTIDVEVPRPDIAIDLPLPPPPDGPPTGCNATGPILSVFRVNGRNSEACAGQVAAHTFTHALCACGDLSLGQGLQTGSFDSMAADRTLVISGAPVGVKGNYPAVGARIGGSLTVAGTAMSMSPVSGLLYVNGDLRLAASTTFASYLTIERDAWIASKSQYFSVASVGRNYYYVPPGGLIGIIPVFATARIPLMSITVADPCRCDERLDVAAMETAGALKVDNTDRGALTNVTTATTRELVCGRFRFDSIGGTAAIQLNVTGRTAIFVDRDVTASDLFELVLTGPDAEVDWFIAGNLTVGAAKLGSLTRPSATRIYVAGSNDIQLPSELIGANIYAPNANVSINAGSLAGSVHAKNLSVPSGAYVKYDRAILHQGDKCESPIVCDKCYSCNSGAACIDSTCGTCTKDDDCCLPLVCEQGLCQQLLR